MSIVLPLSFNLPTTTTATITTPSSEIISNSSQMSSTTSPNPNDDAMDVDQPSVSPNNGFQPPQQKLQPSIDTDIEKVETAYSIMSVKSNNSSRDFSNPSSRAVFNRASIITGDAAAPSSAIPAYAELSKFSNATAAVATATSTSSGMDSISMITMNQHSPSGPPPPRSFQPNVAGVAIAGPPTSPTKSRMSSGSSPGSGNFSGGDGAIMTLLPLPRRPAHNARPSPGTEEFSGGAGGVTSSSAGPTEAATAMVATSATLVSSPTKDAGIVNTHIANVHVANSHSRAKSSGDFSLKFLLSSETGSPDSTKPRPVSSSTQSLSKSSDRISSPPSASSTISDPQISPLSLTYSSVNTTPYTITHQKQHHQRPAPYNVSHVKSYSMPHNVYLGSDSNIASVSMPPHAGLRVPPSTATSSNTGIVGNLHMRQASSGSAMRLGSDHDLLKNRSASGSQQELGSSVTSGGVAAARPVSPMMPPPPPVVRASSSSGVVGGAASPSGPGSKSPSPTRSFAMSDPQSSLYHGSPASSLSSSSTSIASPHQQQLQYTPISSSIAQPIIYQPQASVHSRHKSVDIAHLAQGNTNRMQNSLNQQQQQTIMKLNPQSLHIPLRHASAQSTSVSPQNESPSRAAVISGHSRSLSTSVLPSANSAKVSSAYASAAAFKPSESNGDLGLDGDISDAALDKMQPPVHDDDDSDPRGVYRCPHETCGKYFTRRYNLLSHMRVHSGERPYPCKLCNAEFSRKHDLRRHIRSLHSEDRPHQCNHCNLSFARSDALKRHLASEVKRGNNSHTMPPEENFGGGGGVSSQGHRRTQSSAAALSSSHSQPPYTGT